VSAIIDFDHVGMGDPACDMMIAWTMLSDAERPDFRARMRIDDSTWERGRGWTLNLGVAALAFGGPQDLLATVGRRALHEFDDRRRKADHVAWRDAGCALTTAPRCNKSMQAYVTRRALLDLDRITVPHPVRPGQ
jgi:aminoglycoside phosphotransferase (APT) family kinase protein